jgi:hypothetical protein
MFGGTAATHSVGAAVVGLSEAQVNYQIVAGTIVNADINSLAAIDQSKLALNFAASTVSSPTVTTVAATALVAGKRYRIASQGTTTSGQWTAAGSTVSSNNGTVFQATGATGCASRRCVAPTPPRTLRRLQASITCSVPLRASQHSAQGSSMHSA